MNKKLRVIVLVSILVGAAICFVSWGKLNDYQQRQLDMVNVVGAAKNIEAYSVLSDENLKTISVSSKFTDEYTVFDGEDIKGKVTNIPIYAGKPLDSRYITDKPKDIGDRQVVGVNIDAVRYSGVNNGDIVDVFWVGSKEQFTAAQKLASNARVLKIANNVGEEIKEIDGAPKSTVVSAGLTKEDTPAIVYLLVKPEEVPYVIQGANKANADKIALAKKSEETKDIKVSDEEVTEEAFEQQ